MTDADAYLTVAAHGRAHLTDRGSEFRCHVAPVESIEAAEQFVTEIADAHADATHNVPAYRVHADPFREYASDEGEPSGSAGKPMLGVLEGRDLENVAAVTTRYYGGTKLGVGGLVRAYAAVTAEAVEAAGIVERRPRRQFEAVVTYDDSGTVRGILESAGVTFDADYGEHVRFKVSVPIVEAEALLDRLRSATSGRAELTDR